MATDYSQMSDADLDVALAKIKSKPAPVDYSKMSDAEIDAAHAKLMNGQPGVSSIGTPDGNPTPAAQDEPVYSKLKRFLGSTIHNTANALDYARGATTAPLLGLGLEATTGKPTFSGDEYARAITPGSGQAFPGANELYRRAGVPEGAKLSDYLSMYQQPGHGKWYQPEKGGMLDPTLRGTGGFATDVAIDPLSWLSMGAAGLGKKALAEGATKAIGEEMAREAAAKSSIPVGKILNAAGDIGEAAGDKITSVAQPMAAAVKSIPKIGPAAIDAATFPSKITNWIGQKLYNSPLLPMEFEGNKFGKQGVDKTLYDLGITNPINLSDKTQTATNKLISARDKILQNADAAGATVPMSDAVAPAQAAIAKLRDIKDSEAHAIADQLEAKLSEYKAREQGSPGVPASSKAIPTGVLDENGQQIMKTEAVPAQPGIPGQTLSPSMATKLKTFLYKSLPTNTWNVLSQNPEANAVRQKLAGGLKTGVEDSVERTLGPQDAKNLTELNQSAGNLLSTQKSTARVENQADRLAHGTVSPTGTAKVMGILAGPQGTVADMALNAGRLMSMPAGYGMRKLAEGQLTAPLIDAYLRRKLIDKGAVAPEGANNGQ